MTRNWTAFAKAEADIKAIFAEQSAAKYPKGSPEFTALVTRLLAAQDASSVALGGRPKSALYA